MRDADRLFHTYFEPLVRYLTRQTGDRDAAEELTQETFLRALRHGALHRAQPDNERAWIFTIATNLMRDSLRYELRQQRGLERLHTEQRAAVTEPRWVAGDIDNIRSTVEPDGGESSPALRALHALSERDRSALLMSEEGLSYNEIAATLGISVQSVGTTLSRARRRLAQHYESLSRSHSSPGGNSVTS